MYFSHSIFKGFRHFRSTALLAGVLAASSFIGGCASDSSNIAIKNTEHLLTFTVTVNSNGVIDQTGNGYYAILLNSQGNAIEVTDLDTFTDIIRYDGINFDWYTRQANLPNPGFTFTHVGSLNHSSSISSDGTQLQVVIDLSDSTNYLSQHISADKFTAHLMTTDNYESAILGRVLDTMGESISSNSLQTVLVDKLLGAIEPFPTYYPDDPLNDWITRNDLDPDFPYTNFDIARFEITASTY
ncbi:MAG: hypothetical protein K6G50_02760 [bacterium]|nr:hypothetical protein [bacterium]